MAVYGGGGAALLWCLLLLGLEGEGRGCSPLLYGRERGGAALLCRTGRRGEGLPYCLWYMEGEAPLLYGAGLEGEGRGCSLLFYGAGLEGEGRGCPLRCKTGGRGEELLFTF